MALKQLIFQASGKVPADLLLKNARIVDVYSGEIVSGDIAVKDGIILGLGDYDAVYVEDLAGRYVAPGFMDAHVHIESSMAGVDEFAKAVAVCGTTAVVADPHEIANVLGVAGIEYMIQAAEGLPVDIFFALPSCVPASVMETAGADIRAQDLAPFMTHPRVKALAEMMNFPGVVAGDPLVLAKLALAHQHGLVIDGHAPGLSGKALNAYAAAGIASDHECTTKSEALEKLAAGMHIMVREGTAAKNLEKLLPAITPTTCHRMMWCTDDRHPHDLLADGHIDAVVRKAIRLGLDPVTAIQMATLNPARYFGLANTGAVAPGKKAHLVVFSDLSCPVMEKVYAHGQLVAENGKVLPAFGSKHIGLPPNAMHVSVGRLDFSLPAKSSQVHVMTLIEEELITSHDIKTVKTDENGMAVSDPDRDLLKIAVVERHKNTGNVGMGFVSGFGLKTGALASSVAHDAHNIIVVGTSDPDMKAAVAQIVSMGGGMAVVNNGLTLAHLALPVAGLMAEAPMGKIRDDFEAVLTAAGSMGARPVDPFMILSFLALPVIPELKITDRGIVDVSTFEIIPLFV